MDETKDMIAPYINPDPDIAARHEEASREHIEKLSQRYRGASYQGPTGSRHLHRIALDSVFTGGRPRRN